MLFRRLSTLFFAVQAPGPLFLRHR